MLAIDFYFVSLLLNQGHVGHRPMRAWFLEIISSANVGVYVCVRVCVCLPPKALITSHMKSMRNNWIKQFCGLSFLYMTPASIN